MTTFRFFRLFLALVLMAVCIPARAQPSAHYCPGGEGVLCASLPPPGLYLRDYNIFYTADRLDDPNGKSAGPPNFNTFVYAQVPRLVWVSNTKFLGGNVGASALVPIEDIHARAGSFDSTTFSAGDLYVDVLDAWHWKQFDFVFAPGMWLPTGDSSAPPTTRAGMGYFSGMFTVGGVAYLDRAKTWSISAVNRYEINDEQRYTHITPGQAYTVDWGIGKQVARRLNLGLAGYYQQQVTSDSGSGAVHVRDRVIAVGPEINVTIPKIDVLASLRALREVAAEDRAQGETIVLTLTWRF